MADSAKTAGDLTLQDGPVTLERFTAELSIDHQRIAALEAQIAADRKKPRKPSASTSARKLDITPEMRIAGLRSKLQRTQKCANYQFGEVAIDSDDRVEIAVTTHVVGGIKDNDRAIVVREHGVWRIANPLHIIR